VTASRRPPLLVDPVRLRRLLASSTFRLVFLGALLFTGTSVGVLSGVKVVVGTLLDQRVDFTIDGETDRLRQILAQGGMRALADELSLRMASLQGRQRIYQLVDTSNMPLVGNLGEWPQVQAIANGRVRFTVPPHLDDAGSRVRAVVLDLGDNGRLLVGRVQTDRAIFDRVVDRTMLGLGLVCLGLGVLVSLIMARMVLRRLDSINGTAEVILQGKLDGRVALSGNGDEFDQLAAKFNTMLERIDGLMAAMRDVTRNIAHDLRTPLNRLRNRLELAMLAAEKGTVDDAELAAALREADTIIATFNAVLRIAQVEGCISREQFKAVPADRVIADVADLYLPLADDQGVALDVVADPGLWVRGDSHLLFQAVANLVDNAIKYTPTGGAIHLIARGGQDGVRVTVADTGPGIPASQREAVLRPFVRLDASRHQPGMGLGLSMVAAIVALHDARLELDDNAPGLRATIVLAASL
jgi:signal transduction histidine kinase